MSASFTCTVSKPVAVFIRQIILSDSLFDDHCSMSESCACETLDNRLC